VIRRFFALLILVYSLGFAVFMLALGSPGDSDTPTDAIVVPTGGAGRIDRGIALLQAHAAKRMLVTGVDRDVRPIELAIEYRVSPRLFECCIDLGREAVDTRSNGEETARWVAAHGYRSIRLVTSSWHMPRARMELGHALGSDVTIVSDPVQSEAGLGMLFREYNKYLVRRIALWAGW